MTEIRRSWMGRRNVSTGVRPKVITCSVLTRSPAEEPRHESFRKGVGSGRKFDEAVGAGQCREVTGAIGGAGFGRSTAPVVVAEFHRQIERQRRLHFHWC